MRAPSRKGGFGDIHGRPAHFQIEFAGHRQQGIAQRFPLQPPTVCPGEQPILRVKFPGPRIVLARFLVNARGHDPAMQLLDRPAFVHETPGEIIQQLRMAGRFAADAEVARGGDEPGPEMVQPEPIDETRAVSGLSLSAMACASSSRPLPSWNGWRSGPASTSRNCRGTTGPGLFGLPRRSTRAVAGLTASTSTMARGGANGEPASNASAFFSGPSAHRETCDCPPSVPPRFSSRKPLPPCRGLAAFSRMPGIPGSVPARRCAAIPSARPSWRRRRSSE